TFWPSSRFMPRTPRAVRPIGRTSFSSKRTALPESENSITSCSPSVSAAPIRKSPSSRSTAIMPALRGLLKSLSGVFLTVPRLVDPVVFLGRHRLLAAAAAFLRAVLGHRLRLHVTGVRQGHHHVLRRDQVFGLEVGGVHLDGRAALVLVAHAVLVHRQRHLVD